MKQNPHTHRRAIAMLLAAVVLPATPAFAQDIQPLPVPVQTAPTPRVAPPPVVSVAPPAAPQTVQTPPQAIQTVQPLPPVAEPEPQAPAAAAPARSAARAAPQSRARPAQPAPAPAAVTAAPALTPVPIAPPVATIEPVAPPPAERVAAEPVAPAPAPNDSAPWIWLVAGLAVIAAIAGLLAWRRRRSAEEYYDEVYDEPVHQPALEPVVEPVPDAMVAAVPVIPAAALHIPAAAQADVVSAHTEPAHAETGDSVADAETVSVSDADSADVDAMVASSSAPAGRPWLELMMRPMRAGTNRDDAIVEFELTVGNAGDVPAKDVRISTWMFAAGSAQGSEMERMLIEPPADATVSEVTIAPGDGTRIEAAIALPTAQGANGSVLPVLVADARYTLADGSEGRTSASFEIGLARGDEIEGFSTARPTGMHEDIDARLHAEPQHA
jgi:hypothetical protein